MTITKSKSLAAIIIAIIFLPIEATVETKNIESCADIKDDIQRLSCFDSFFNEDDDSIIQQDETKDKLENGSIVKKESKEQERTKDYKRNFGLPKQQDDNKNKDMLFTKVEKTKKTKNNKILFTMVNGQVWLAESSYRARNFFKPDTNIRIEQAPVSGYQMIALDKNQKIRIKRIK
tara:strand:- start:10035 stop:10562 length:528 start_codon:yes stop_codon:yes gene_type:complete